MCVCVCVCVLVNISVDLSRYIFREVLHLFIHWIAVGE